MKRLIVIFLNFAILLNSNSVLAQEELSQATVSALVKKIDHIANIRERIQERINLFFKFSNDAKADYQKELAEKRLAEVFYVVESEKGDFIEETTSRYSTYLGRLTETLVKNKLASKKDDTLKMLDEHKMVLNELVKYFESNSGFWLLIMHNINSIDIYKSQLEKL